MSLIKKLFRDATSSKKQKFHFIIVDDNLFELKLAEKAVKNLNRHITFHTFNTGSELIYHFNTNEYKDEHRIVLFLDIQMPNKTGIETISDLNKIINLNLKNKIHVFFLTASLDQEDYEKVKSISTKYQYVLKPISESSLSNMIDNI